MTNETISYSNMGFVSNACEYCYLLLVHNIRLNRLVEFTSERSEEHNHTYKSVSIRLDNVFAANFDASKTFV
jgi:hypothetical protein